MPEAARIRLGAIILGAGASSRMGQPKLLLPWANSTIIGHLLSLWQSLGAEQIAIVCAPLPHALHGELDRLKFPTAARIVNPAPELGMFSSIQCAVRWSGWHADLTHFALLLGDQPQIRRGTLEFLLNHTLENPHSICQPAWKGRPKHPVILPRIALELLASSKCGTLREFLENSGFPRSLVEITDESLACDLDSPADYADALRRFA